MWDLAGRSWPLGQAFEGKKFSFCSGAVLCFLSAPIRAVRPSSPVQCWAFMVMSFCRGGLKQTFSTHILVSKQFGSSHGKVSDTQTAWWFSCLYVCVFGRCHHWHWMPSIFDMCRNGVYSLRAPAASGISTANWGRLQTVSLSLTHHV